MNKKDVITLALIGGLYGIGFYTIRQIKKIGEEINHIEGNKWILCKHRF